MRRCLLYDVFGRFDFDRTPTYEQQTDGRRCIVYCVKNLEDGFNALQSRRLSYISLGIPCYICVVYVYTA